MSENNPVQIDAASDDKPLVSVIIPTHNRVGYLSRSLASVVSQTYTNIEIIVVDDGSTDTTEQFVTNVADERIRYIKLPKNMGQSTARNTGIEQASADYITFLDSDDVWHLQCLEYQMSLMTRNDNYHVGAVQCDSQKTIGKPRPADSREAYEWMLYWKYPLQMNSLLVRKECFQTIGTFDTSLIAYEDWELLLRLSRTYSVLYQPIELTYIDEHKGPRVTNNRNHIGALEALIKKYADVLRDRPQVLAFWEYRLAFQYRAIGDVHSSRDHIGKSLRIWPWSARRWLIYVIHLLPGMETKQRVLQQYANVANRTSA